MKQDKRPESRAEPSRQQSILRPGVFLDRDGTINDGSGYYVLHYDDFRFLPGALEAIAQLAAAGAAPIVVSNQSCVARGLAMREEIEEIHRRMREEIREAGGWVLDVLFCPHDDADDCPCRKPRPGMLRLAAQRHGLDLARSVYVGDRGLDLAAARAAGCAFVLVGNEPLPPEAGAPDHSAPSLLDAVPWILNRLARVARQS